MSKSTDIIIIFFSLLMMAASSPQMDKILILTDDRIPFEYKDDSGKITGIAANIVTCALQKINISYEIKMVPWKRAQEQVKNGRADAFFAASQNSDRDQYAVLSAIVANQYWNWYLLKSTPLDPGTPDFKSKGKTSSWFGSNSLKWLKHNGYRVTTQPKTLNLLAKQLEMKRIDAILCSNFAIESVLKKTGLMDKVKIIKGLHKPMGVYISKKYLVNNPNFLVRFNKAILTCHQK